MCFPSQPINAVLMQTNKKMFFWTLGAPYYNGHSEEHEHGFYKLLNLKVHCMTSSGSFVICAKPSNWF